MLDVRIGTEDADGSNPHAASRLILDWLGSIEERTISLARHSNLSKAYTDLQEFPGLLARTAIALQGLVGSPVRFSEWSEGSEPGESRVLVEYEVECLARACLDLACLAWAVACRGERPDFAAEVQAIRDLADDQRIGPSTEAVVMAAQKRGIPFQRLNDASLVQFGHGSRQRRVWTAESDRTSVLACEIASDKELTRSLLSTIGIPVPEGRPARSSAEAWQVASELGLPVVVKPRDANRGRGVSVNLSNREQVEAAFEVARCIRRDYDTEVLVERFIPGIEHRLLIVGARLVAAYRGEPPFVIGDGLRTVAELVDELNRDPRRGPEEYCPLGRIKLDTIAELILQNQGYTLASVPPAGARVMVRRNADHCVEVTASVHPRTVEIAVEAARFIGLDIAGIDLIVPDISGSLEEQGGAIVEVNAGPGLINHLKPDEGEARPVGMAILESLYPGGEDGRIPLLVVTGGAAGRTEAAHLAARLLKGLGRNVGLAAADGLHLGSRRFRVGDMSGFDGARDLLLNPAVELAVIEVDPAHLQNDGLGFDCCDVVLVLGEEEERASGAAALHATATDDPIRELIAASPQSTAVFVEMPRRDRSLETPDDRVFRDRLTMEAVSLPDREVTAILTACRAMLSLLA